MAQIDQISLKIDFNERFVCGEGGIESYGCGVCQVVITQVDPGYARVFFKRLSKSDTTFIIELIPCEIHLLQTFSRISLDGLCNRHQSSRCELIVGKVNLD